MPADGCAVDAMSVRAYWSEGGEWVSREPLHRRSSLLVRVRTAVLGAGAALVLGALVTSVALAGGEGKPTPSPTPEFELGSRPNLITPAPPGPDPLPSATSRPPTPTPKVIPAAQPKAPAPVRKSTPKPSATSSAPVRPSIQPWPEYPWPEDDYGQGDDCRNDPYDPYDRYDDRHHHDHCW